MRQVRTTTSNARYGSDLTDITVDVGDTHDQTVGVSQSVYDMFETRGLDAASAQWFVQALITAGMTDPDQPGQFVTDVAAMASYYQRSQRVEDEKTGWDKYKHIILPFAALGAAFIPVAGPYLSGAVMLTDAGFYYYEGDPLDGTISALTALLPIGAARLAAKWSTTTFTAAELKALNQGRSVIIDDYEFRLDAGELTVTPVNPIAIIETRTWYPSSPDLANHLKTVERFNAGDGVVGGHNIDSLDQAYRDHSLDPDIYVDSTTEIFPGVYELEYRVPRLEPDGITLKPDQTNLKVRTKTVYDPAVISDADMLIWAEDAMMDPHPVPNRPNLYEGVAPNGLKFNGYLNNGQWTSIFPVSQ